MNTIDYYNNNANKFVADTVYIDFKETQDKFLSKLSGNRVLDFGCGSGRDTKYFLNKGYTVEAIDGSEELCRMASQYTGIQVKQMLFNELSEKNKYNGIWACASILHLPKNELKTVLLKMTDALCSNGVVYTSFKYGKFEGERQGRFFTDFTPETFTAFISDISNIKVLEYWFTDDVRPNRTEKWLNLLLQKH